MNRRDFLKACGGALVALGLRGVAPVHEECQSYVDGEISNVQVYDYELSPEETVRIYVDADDTWTYYSVNIDGRDCYIPVYE